MFFPPLDKEGKKVGSCHYPASSLELAPPCCCLLEAVGSQLFWSWPGYLPSVHIIREPKGFFSRLRDNLPLSLLETPTSLGCGWPPAVAICNPVTSGNPISYSEARQIEWCP